MCVCAVGKMVISPLELGTENQNFLENINSTAKFQLVDLILAMTAYFPV